MYTRCRAAQEQAAALASSLAQCEAELREASLALAAERASATDALARKEVRASVPGLLPPSCCLAFCRQDSKKSPLWGRDRCVQLTLVNAC